MKKYRFTILFGLLLIVWLIFGPQILDRVVRLFSPLDRAPALEGRLLYTQGFDGIWQMDMADGTVTPWWTPPEGGMVTGIAASPGGIQVAIAYAPPAVEGFQIGTTDLYLSPLDTPDLQALLVREDRNESYRNPAWSPDGQQLYYTHLEPQRNDDGSTAGIALKIDRVDLSLDDAPVTVIGNAEQARLSSDGTQMVYLKFDPVSYGKGLWLMDVDGDNARELLPDGDFADLASAIFTPDDSRIVFSGSGEFQEVSIPSLLSFPLVQAHGLPWNIWEIGLEGEAMVSLTETTLDGPRMAWGQDNTSMAILAAEGVFVVHEGQSYRVADVTGEGEITWTS